MKIKHNLIQGNIKQILPNIYAFIVKNDYDRAMLFCRYQEYYESPYKELRNKFTSMEEFMKIYTIKRKKNYFSYPDDWAGYNIPSNVLLKCYNEILNSNSYTQYDWIMREIIYFCEKRSKGKPFYLIGVDDAKSWVMKHEIAHGIYYTNPNYKESVNELISKIEIKDYNFIKKQLLKIGYVNDKKIIDDEINAYLSTGPNKSFAEVAKKYTSKFKKNLNKYK